MRKSPIIPIFFHNFRGYDGHLIAAALSQFEGLDIKVIGQGMEKYLTLTLGKYLVFKDSYQFLGTSLQRLAENLLAAGIEKFTNLRASAPENTSEENLKLLLRKGVYPYDYMNGWEKFDETALPPKEAFYDKLHDKAISDEDYAHAQQVWNAFGCDTMQKYHDLYLKGMALSMFCFPLSSFPL